MTFPTLVRGDPPGPLRVLVADEDPDTADSLAQLLGLVGCETAVAYHGVAVLPLAGRFRPDACVLGLRMTGVDGLEVARRLRGGPGGERLLLLAVTGMPGRYAARRSAAAGFDRHLLKPADPIGLVSFLATGVPRGLVRPRPRSGDRLARPGCARGQPAPGGSCHPAAMV